MKTFLKEIKFPSTDQTYLRDITADVNRAIKKAKVKTGFVFVNSKHTTLGIVINEITEPHLLADILDHTLHHVPEDRRSTRVNKDYKHPTADYTHRFRTILSVMKLMKIIMLLPISEPCYFLILVWWFQLRMEN